MSADYSIQLEYYFARIVSRARYGTQKIRSHNYNYLVFSRVGHSSATSANSRAFFELRDPEKQAVANVVMLLQIKR